MFGRRTILAALISVLATVALGVSIYLTWVTWQSGSVAGCTGESLLDCDDVLTSRWSKWLGVLPVSLLGGIAYAAILGLVWPAAGRPRGIAVTSLLGISLLVAGAAVWFIGLQSVQLQSFCAYCLTVHACGLCVSVLSLLLFLDGSGGSNVEQARSLLGVAAAEAPAFEDEKEPISVTSLLTALSLAAVGLVGLMGGQLLVEPANTMAMEEMDFEPAEVVAQAPSPKDMQVPDTQPSPQPEQPSNAEVPANSQDQEDEENKDDGDDLDWLENSTPTDIELPAAPATIGSIFGNDSALNLEPGKQMFQAIPGGIDPADMPLLGNPEAPHLMVEMMDYTCKHCRELHPHLQAALQRYSNQLGVIVYNVPLSKKCNHHIEKDYPGKKYACDYAQLAIGVWKLAPQKYEEYHNWLLEGEKAPSIVKAKKRARELAGDAILLDKELKADTSLRLYKQADHFKRLNTGLPILLLPNGGLKGVPETTEKLFEFMEAKLGVVAP